MRGSLSIMMMALVCWLTPGARAADFAARAQGFFSGSCVGCHDADRKEGGLDLSTLAWRPDDSSIFDRWVKVCDKVDQEKMPPPKKKRAERQARAEFLS